MNKARGSGDLRILPQRFLGSSLAGGMGCKASTLFPEGRQNMQTSIYQSDLQWMLGKWT